MNLIQELQREKEEMQEVVESLIRRGELFLCARPSPPFRPTPVWSLVLVERSKGNFERWPSSKMCLPIPAGKFGHKSCVLYLNVVPGRSTGFIDITPVPVTSPRMEALLHALAFERRRYQQVSEALHNAHETILTLEAQVVRRDAELESQDHQRIADVRPIPQKRSIVESLHPDLPEVPLSEVAHSLSIAEEDNYALEREIRELNNRVSYLTPLVLLP